MTTETGGETRPNNQPRRPRSHYHQRRHRQARQQANRAQQQGGEKRTLEGEDIYSKGSSSSDDES